MNPILNKLLRFKTHHLVFWVIYYMGWVYVYKDFYTNFNHLLLVTLIYALAHGSMYYVIQYVFIPRLLKKKSFVAFIAAIIGLLCITTLWMYTAIAIILSQKFASIYGVPMIQFMITLAFSNVFMTSVLISIKALLDYFRNSRQEERKNKERLEAELQYLKAQVNPHFLFNTINSVYVLIQQNPKKASETLIKLSDLLRAQLYDFGMDKISIDQELQYLENYIELERLRKGDKLVFEMEISPDVMGFSIAPLVLIPFLENAFKHVSAPAGEKNTIQMKLDVTNDIFSAYFFNTCDKEQEKISQQPGGIGLKNIRRRLELLYPGRYTLDIKDQHHSFEVKLTLKIHDS